MSKKIKISKHLQKGRFYHFHEGGVTGHPGMIYWKSDKKNLYLALTTDSSRGSHRTSISPTSPNVNQSYVNNRPLLAKRKDIGGKKDDMKFNKKDKKLLKSISEKPFRETRSIRAKDRYYMKKLKKRPKY